MTRVTKEQYQEYLQRNPFITIQDLADHFGIKRSLVASHLLRFRILLKDYRKRAYHGIPRDEIKEFASNHTMKEIKAHFNMGMPLQTYIFREKIDFIRETRGNKDGKENR